MEELKCQIRSLEEKFSEVIPLLVVDEWELVNEKMPQIFQGIADLLGQIIDNQECLKDIRLDEIQNLVKRLVYALNISDSIQIADILLYDMRNVFQSIRSQDEVL